MTLTFGSLFAGVGGLDLGLERAGMVCKWQCEIDDYATRVLEKHWPGVPKYRDVREFPPAEGVEKVDLICGGFPCQDVSVANTSKTGGSGVKDGTRSGLWGEFIRIVRNVGPGWVVAENSPALSLRGLNRVLRDLAESGYDAEWTTLRASQFGARHRRTRMFVIAYANSYGLEGRRVLPQEAPVPTLGQVRNWPHISTPIGLRSSNGVPDRMDRTRVIGNAVVPQVAEFIGRAIVKAVAEMG